MAQLKFGRPIEFDEGWEVMEMGLKKLEKLVAGKSDSQFTPEERMSLYEIVYDMCTQKGPYDHSERLYNKYKETFEAYLSSVVLPSLQEKDDGESLLREFVKRWSNHKIDHEREGKQIDSALLKDVVGIFVEIGLNHYEDDLEAKILDATAAYYSQKAASLCNLEDSSPDHTLKVEDCLKLETDRVSRYLHPSTEPKLLEEGVGWRKKRKREFSYVH
ncbi:OLC1v1019395C1 [Oldenlandia corymbosa var. corymbosa]|uniref:OLC1v1019395C1 n=1 Tax=Oldenlandia corymbosa var. corymbosa TaxID=529605 RepID=A0AAV1EDT8_OLDCO|nr:OLC1v1019395C1 [Oldenlandia corymbosa var. corymbosa]